MGPSCDLRCTVPCSGIRTDVGTEDQDLTIGEKSIIGMITVRSAESTTVLEVQIIEYRCSGKRVLPQSDVDWRFYVE